MSYILGVDYGLKYIGIALSDKNGIYSSPYSLKLNNKEFLPYFNKLLQEYTIDIIVVGNPLNSQGEDSDFSLEIKKFISHFKDSNLSFILWNETLTSKQASKYLTKKRKRIDDIAANIILQEYLDFKNENIAK